MDRRAFLSLLAISPALAASSFDDFKNEMDGEFDLYQQQLNEEFSEYKKILSEEFSNYKSNLSKTWRDSTISSRHVWVQYSDDYKIRSLVDFERNTLKVEAIKGKNNSTSTDDIETYLSSLLKQDAKTALQRDGLVRNIEARLSDFQYVVKGDVPAGESILGLAYEGEPVASAGLNVVTAFANEAVYSPEKSFDAPQVKGVLASAKSGVTQESQGQSAQHVVINLPSNFLKRRAKKQAPVVLARSDKYKVNFPTLMSVMHTESTFNPLALSESAYGLMMINPETSGRRAHKMIFGQEKILTPSFLTNNVNNIEYGSAYFHLLYFNYLKGITLPENRLLCAISAYNAGLGNVARAFSGRPVLKKAMDMINTKKPDAVLKILQDKLPYEENKIYLSKVNERTAYYSE